MELSYQSTRGGETGVTASQAILKGLADDGGLFMPTFIPKLDKTMEELAGMTYQETAYEVMKLFLTDYTEEELKNCMTANLTPGRSLLWQRRMALISWSYTTGARSHLRIWLFPFCRI